MIVAVHEHRRLRQRLRDQELERGFDASRARDRPARAADAARRTTRASAPSRARARRGRTAELRARRPARAAGCAASASQRIAVQRIGVAPALQLRQVVTSSRGPRAAASPRAHRSRRPAARARRSARAARTPDRYGADILLVRRRVHDHARASRRCSRRGNSGENWHRPRPAPAARAASAARRQANACI